MAAWNTSSLAFSDHSPIKGGKSLLKRLPTRVSKSDIATNRMFGSKRKNIQLGKTFKKSGKGIMKGATSSDHMPKSSGISPSIEDFDKMMASITKGSSKSGVISKSNGFSKKKSFFNRKQFG